MEGRIATQAPASVAQPRSHLRGRMAIARYGGRMLIYLLLMGGVLFFALPLVWMLTSSLKAQNDVYQFPPQLIFAPQWHNYVDLFAQWPFWKYLRNSLTITVPSVLGQVISSSLVAYGFSRMRWPGRNLVFVVVLATLMLPYQVTLVPLYIIFRQLGWIGTFAPLIVPNWFASAFDIFLLRQFFLSIPGELTDAARIDGCGHLRIYWRIVVPLGRPALATVCLFEFLNNWNDFLGPLVYLQNNDLYTLTVGLNDFQNRFGIQPQLQMGACTLTILPVVMVFIFAQRTFIQGITLTGLKG